jgi:hypothetical protein
MVVLSIHPDSFALVLEEKDTFSGLRSSIAEKLSLAEGAANDFVLKYERDGVLYTLYNGAWNFGPLCASRFGLKQLADDDWKVFIARVSRPSVKLIHLHVSGSAIPPAPPTRKRGKRGPHSFLSCAFLLTKRVPSRLFEISFGRGRAYIQEQTTTI